MPRQLAGRRPTGWPMGNGWRRGTGLAYPIFWCETRREIDQNAYANIAFSHARTAPPGQLMVLRTSPAAPINDVLQISLTMRTTRPRGSDRETVLPTAPGGVGRWLRTYRRVNETGHKRTPRRSTSADRTAPRPTPSRAAASPRPATATRWAARPRRPTRRRQPSSATAAVGCPPARHTTRCVLA